MEIIEGDMPFQVYTEEVRKAIQTAVDELDSFDTNIKRAK